jgi:hypothetical protein
MGYAIKYPVGTMTSESHIREGSRKCWTAQMISGSWMTCKRAGHVAPQPTPRFLARSTVDGRMRGVQSSQQGSAVDRHLNTLHQPSLFVRPSIPLESSRAVCATVLYPLCHQDSNSLSVRQASDLADNHVQHVTPTRPGRRQHDLTLTPAAALSQSCSTPCTL